MPGGNFDDVLTISGGHVVAQGPLSLPSGSTDVSVYAWVMQRQTSGDSAAFTGERNYSSPPSRWVADSSKDDYGTFVPGPAMGTAVAIYKLGGKTQVFWWSEDIRLQ